MGVNLKRVKELELGTRTEKKRDKMTDRESDIDDGGLDEQTNALLAHVRALALQSDSESDNDSEADLGGMGEFTAALGSLVREGHVPRSTEVKILSDFSTHTIERIPFGTLIPANVPPSPDRPRLSFEDILENLKNGKYKNIMLCVGAGISTAAGIPGNRLPTWLNHSYPQFQTFGHQEPDCTTT